MGRHMGRTLFEIYHDTEFQTQHHKFIASGPGALKEAQAADKGIIFVSGHFGQWEAVRAVIKMHGLESGAVYRPQKNCYYDSVFLLVLRQEGSRFWQPAA